MTTNKQLIVKENLIKVKEIIKDPAHWTQGEKARNATGAVTSPHNEDAVCFCLGGAVEKVVYSGFTKSQSALMGNAMRYSNIMHCISVVISSITNTSLNKCRIDEFNDTNNHTEVISMLDKAIELCKYEDCLDGINRSNKMNDQNTKQNQPQNVEDLQIHIHELNHQIQYLQSVNKKLEKKTSNRKLQQYLISNMSLEMQQIKNTLNYQNALLQQIAQKMTAPVHLLQPLSSGYNPNNPFNNFVGQTGQHEPDYSPDNNYTGMFRSPTRRR